MKLGRRRPTARQRTRALKLRDYLGPGLPSPPDACNYVPRGLPAVQQMYGNDVLGDCVVAGYYHVLGVATGNATGTPFLATEQQIEHDYSAIGGYVPGDTSTDQGCDEVTALEWWIANPAADGSQLAGYVEIDPTNVLHVRLALWLSGALYICQELPDEWLPTSPGEPIDWRVAGSPNPANGHCIAAFGYGAPGLITSTWGTTGTESWRALAEYGSAQNGGSVMALLTPDWVARGQRVAPSGIDWNTLRADVESLRSSFMQPVGP